MSGSKRKGTIAVRVLSERVAELFCEPAHRVAILAGPAWSGKSAALAQADSATAMTAVLYRIGDDHLDLFGFARGLAEAIAPHVRGPVESYSAIFERISGGDDRVSGILRWFCAHVPHFERVIAIDNAERVSEHVQIAQLLGRLVEESGLRWLISTRRTGRLPVGTWMARGLMGIPVDTSPQNGARAIDIESMLDTLTDADRDFIERAAELPRMEAVLLRDVGIRNAGERLADFVDRFSLFFEAGSPPTLRYDVRHAIKRRLRRDNPGRYLDAVRAAGTALERRHDLSEALSMYVRELQSDAADQLLQRHGLDVWESVASDTVERALSLLPSESSSNATVLALRAAAASRSGRYDVSEALYVNAIVVSSGSMKHRISYAYGCDLLRRSRWDCAGVFEKLLTDVGLEIGLEAAIRSALAQVYAARGDGLHASEQSLRAIELIRGSGDIRLADIVRTRAAYAAFYARRDMRAAHELATAALESAWRHHAYVTAAGALSILYNVACENDDSPAVRDYLAKLAFCGQRVGNIDFQSYALMARLEFEVEAHDESAIARTMESLRSFDIHYEQVVTSDVFLPSEALRMSWNGRFVEACELLQPSIDQQIGRDFKALRHAQIALYAAAGDRLEIASAHLETLIELLPSLVATDHKTIRAQIYGALTASLLGRQNEAAAMFDGIRSGCDAFPRLRAFCRSAVALHCLWNGERTEDELRAAIAELSHLHGAGFAFMISRLPMATAIRQRLRPGSKRSLPVSRILALLERYTEIPIYA
ncbi:MAG: hypothetical protein M3R51_10670 [Candidatus Eremiobacteraeota bacterium]|nr:hypothetical protein [Candidatus Eremiobacteraeota bacterium]